VGVYLLNSVSKSTIAWSIAIVAVGAGFFTFGLSFSGDVSNSPVSISETGGTEFGFGGILEPLTETQTAAASPEDTQMIWDAIDDLQLQVNGITIGPSDWLDILNRPAGLDDGDDINDADSDPANELQTIHLSGNYLTISSGGSGVSLPIPTTTETTSGELTLTKYAGTCPYDVDCLVLSQTYLDNVGQNITMEAFCPAGTIVIGGETVGGNLKSSFVNPYLNSFTATVEAFYPTSQVGIVSHCLGFS